MKDIFCSNKDELDKFMYLNGALLRVELSKIGLYMGQPIILSIISKNPGLTQKMLADMGEVKPSTINVMLARMMKNGLVEIKKDEKNSKLSRVYITEKGEKLSTEAIKYKEYIKEKRYKNFSKKEIETFENLISRINENLKSELEEENLNENN